LKGGRPKRCAKEGPAGRNFRGCTGPVVARRNGEVHAPRTGILTRHLVVLESSVRRGAPESIPVATTSQHGTRTIEHRQRRWRPRHRGAPARDEL